MSTAGSPIGLLRPRHLPVVHVGHVQIPGPVTVKRLKLAPGELDVPLGRGLVHGPGRRLRRIVTLALMAAAVVAHLTQSRQRISRRCATGPNPDRSGSPGWRPARVGGPGRAGRDRTRLLTRRHGPMSANRRGRTLLIFDGVGADGFLCRRERPRSPWG